jgi:hypothetical protein
MFHSMRLGAFSCLRTSEDAESADMVSEDLGQQGASWDFQILMEKAYLSGTPRRCSSFSCLETIVCGKEHKPFMDCFSHISEHQLFC